MSDVRAISVRGGSNGIEAHTEQMLALARRLGRTAGELSVQAAILHGYLAHPGVLAATALDPVGAGDFAAQLLIALDGPHGLTWVAVDCAGLDVGLRAAALAYIEADRLDQRVWPALDGLIDLAPSLARATPRLVRGDPVGALDRFLAEDPQFGDLAVDAITGFWTDHALLQTLAAWPDGRPKLITVGRAPVGPGPRSLSALLTNLAERNDGPGGAIDVRIVDGTARIAARPGTPRHVIVDIPGTKNWSLSPQQRDVTSAGTDLRAVTGARTSYQAGVLEALRRAGVTATDDVLLVGHSQGGLVAVNTAAEGMRTGEFRVSHVITVGAPIAGLAVPRSVEVLAIENDGDVVVHADGAGNPDRRNVTTVTLHRNQGELERNHSLRDSYLPGARDIEASADESVRTYLAGLRPFLTGEDTHTSAFLIERG